MEKTKRAAVIPVSYGWSDVGSWHAVWELSQRDENGNAAQGNAVFVDTSNSFASSEKPLVALFGVAGSRGRRKRGCGADRRPQEHRRDEAAGAEAERGGSGGHRRSHPRASALGQLSVARQWRPLSGQAHRREEGRPAFAAVS